MLYQTSNPHGGDIAAHPGALDFSANTNPLGTPPSVIRAAASALSHIDRYPDPFCRDLIHSISLFENIPEPLILCGCGAADLIFSFCNALRPRRALIPVPTFSEYETALKAAGCQPEYYPLRQAENFSLTPSFLSCLEQGTWDTLFLCNPNNPTGQLIPPNLLEQIANICRRKNIRLFLDECFLDLTDSWERSSLKRLLPTHPELFILKAFTKSYGMAGLRLGYCLCGDPDLLRAMGKLTQPWNVSAPAQAAGIAALKETAFLEQTRDLIRQERTWLENNLTALGLEAIPSQTNYILFYSEKKSLWENLAQKRIIIRNCSNYRGLTEGWYRTAVRKREENTRLIETLREVLEDNQHG